MDMQENCLQAYAEKGWLLQFSKDIDSNRQDCFFHDGEYATARREIDGHQVEVSFTTQGALSASLEIYDMSNDFPSSSELSHREKLFGYIPDDATLEQAIGEDRLRFSNTNWNEMYVFVDGKQIGDPLTLENGLLNDFPSPFRLERELKNTYDIAYPSASEYFQKAYIYFAREEMRENPKATLSSINKKAMNLMRETKPILDQALEKTGAR